jgi:hypothetical protein
MTCHPAKLSLALPAVFLSLASPFCNASPSRDATLPRAAAAIIASDDFSRGLDKWVVEQMPGGAVTAKNGVLTIDDKKGCTVWLRQKLTAPVEISYEVTMSAGARVSDLNCFWMASDPKNPADLFHKNHTRTGKFGTYDSLHTYYVGYGANGNTTTRFRRYDGTTDRPLLPENDRSDPALMLKAGRAYTITLIARDGEARFICDGKTIFTHKDPQPLAEGWFAFRTVNSKMLIKNFRVTKPE